MQNPRILANGEYAIVCHEHDGFVFRHPIEDDSRRPKAVYSLFSGVQPTSNWKVDKTDKGLYVLTAKNAPAGYWVQKGKASVFAFPDGPVSEDARPVDWDIKEVLTTEDRNGYIIATKLPDGTEVGWSLQDVEPSQFGLPISVQPLRTTKSNPPRYLPSEVFDFGN
ncbi:hypothetical protein EIP91_011809 [Steccherinum ochraceum]|uniref:Uncharacterized protein n=1 Tax=Steccherinum ochraceum TaxID=92696 RepID=A0A4R0RPA1_9APHY|nr:hypothetical protein EIP91_011809 [Steccherinum ochraceum]